MEILGQTSTQLILFFILYGITGVVPLIATSTAAMPVVAPMANKMMLLP